MSRARRPPAALLHALLAALALACGGCYEGWDQPTYGGNQPPPAPQPPPPPPVKPFGYVLFQPIMMAPDAVANDGCFPKTGIREFKTNEWAGRANAITAALSTLADTVVVHAVAIGAADCDQVTALVAEAAKLTPWDPDASPEADASGKKQLHLTAAFWEGEPQATPPDAVTAADWAAWRTLKAEGRVALSLRYFVVSNPVNGYVSQWLTRWQGDPQLAGDTLTGTPINNVDPTPGGATARDALVKQDTAALTAWLAGKAP